jgi:biopolymer transport protein ExbD
MALRFKRQPSETPELILVPFIDILLVVLIFMAMTATLSRYAELKVELPLAQGQASTQNPKTIWVQVNAQGQVQLERQALGRLSPDELAARLRQIAGQAEPAPMVIIGADARTPHQSVMNIMEAARLAGLGKVAFMSTPPANRKP